MWDDRSLIHSRRCCAEWAACGRLHHGRWLVEGRLAEVVAGRAPGAGGLAKSDLAWAAPPAVASQAARGCVPSGFDTWSSSGGGLVVVRCDCCSGRGWLHGSFAGRMRRRLPFSGVGSAVAGLCRPSVPLLVVRVTFIEGLALSQLQSIALLVPGTARPTSSRCCMSDLVSRPMQQDRARLVPGAAGWVDGGQFWPAYWVSVLGPPRGAKGRTFPLVSLVGVAAGLG